MFEQICQSGFTSRSCPSRISDLKAILISHKEMASIDKEIDAIKSYMVETKFNPHSTMISSLLSKVKSLSDKILKGELSDNEKQQVREGLCVTVRELAIELHNNKHETAGALQLTDGLINIFGDISNAREKGDLFLEHNQTIGAGVSWIESVDPYVSVCVMPLKGCSFLVQKCRLSVSGLLSNCILL